MQLVDEPDFSFGRLVRGSTGPSDVGRRLHADAYQVGPEVFGKVEMRGDVPEGHLGAIVVDRNVEVAGDH